MINKQYFHIYSNHHSGATEEGIQNNCFYFKHSQFVRHQTHGHGLRGLGGVIAQQHWGGVGTCLGPVAGPGILCSLEAVACALMRRKKKKKKA